MQMKVEIFPGKLQRMCKANNEKICLNDGTNSVFSNNSSEHKWPKSPVQKTDCLTESKSRPLHSSPTKIQAD